jgi:hypothetical protein
MFKQSNCLTMGFYKLLQTGEKEGRLPLINGLKNLLNSKLVYDFNFILNDISEDMLNPIEINLLPVTCNLQFISLWYALLTELQSG